MREGSTPREHTPGRLFLCNLVKNRGEIGEKRTETPKNAKNLHDASIKVIVLIWSECNIAYIRSVRPTNSKQDLNLRPIPPRKDNYYVQKMS